MRTILQQMADGDASAAEECVREYGGLVWRLARRYLGPGVEEIEDGAQEVFVELWLSAKRFDPAQGREVAFVATIAHRRLIDRRRRRGRERRGEQPLFEHDGERTLETQSAPHDTQELRHEFNRLPEKEREALWLSLFSGLSHREISIATDAPVGTVKSRLRNGLGRLTRAMCPGRTVPQEGGLS